MMVAGPVATAILQQATPGSDLLWSTVMLIELCSGTLLVSEFCYVTFRSFIAPRNVAYLKHFVAMTATTVLFVALEVMLISVW